MARHASALIHYPRAVPLVACPFCRDLFETQEASHCPTCGIALASVAKLPPSPTLRHEADDWGEDLGPEHDRFAWTFLGRGRGLIVLLSLVGTALFLLPWIDMTLPYTARLSGWDLARRSGWAWGALVAWVVLAPTVASRRTIAQLRGARVAAPFLAAIPAVTAGILLALPPKSGLIPVRIQFDWPIYATVLVSLLALVAGVRLGGRLDVLVAKRGTSAGETLH
jgi:hypothetical protein